MVRDPKTKPRYVYSNKWLKVREDRVIRNGKRGIYSVIERSDCVVVIPITPGGKTILVEQYRYPTLENSIEVPMGGRESGETVEAAARRELAEETGIIAKKLVHIGSFYPAAGLSNQRADVFAAELEENDLNTASHELSEGEITGTQVLSVDEVFKKAYRGEITDLYTLGSLLFLKNYLDRR